MFQNFPAKARGATNNADILQVEAAGGFDLVLQALRELSQYEDDIEAPASCIE